MLLFSPAFHRPTLPLFVCSCTSEAAGHGVGPHRAAQTSGAGRLHRRDGRHLGWPHPQPRRGRRPRWAGLQWAWLRWAWLRRAELRRPVSGDFRPVWGGDGVAGQSSPAHGNLWRCVDESRRVLPSLRRVRSTHRRVYPWTADSTHGNVRAYGIDFRVRFTSSLYVTTWTIVLGQGPIQWLNVTPEAKLTPIAAPLCAVRTNHVVSSGSNKRLWFYTSWKHDRSVKLIFTRFVGCNIT